MNKAELVAAIAANAEISKKDAEKALAAALDTITETLAAGGRVQIVGFGNFKVKERAARKGVSLQSKDNIVFPPCKVVSFKVGKTLRDTLNGGCDCDCDEEE